MKKVLSMVLIFVMVFAWLPLRSEACWAYVSEQDLMENSALIVHAKVIKKSWIFVIKDNEGGREAFVDYYFEPIEVFRGECKSKEIVVRIRRDMPGMWSTSSFDPGFTKGSEHLLFLDIPYGNVAYEMPGEHFYLVGGPQGSYVKEGNDFETWDLENLREMIVPVNESVPIPNAESIFEQSVKNYRTSIDNGVFDVTDEEFEKEIQEWRDNWFSAKVSKRPYWTYWWETLIESIFSR
ncbi:MAG: hypothetical protein FWE47_01680 [Oscillospiraceae bacterium]|nr:hypothetical protein [Oscillospiraceae bacterium]